MWAGFGGVIESKARSGRDLNFWGNNKKNLVQDLSDWVRVGDLGVLYSSVRPFSSCISRNCLGISLAKAFGVIIRSVIIYE